ncbi:tetratricopeptide repeat protein [Minwuia sp.]|uniref:tetratricopeptide repeat protein n=1 Tax=Minwuia sp. TaxID=2493630 RepID=UPI003A8C9829
MLRTIALTVACLLLARAAEAVDTYEACIARVEADPAAGLTEALQWRDLGGGLAARHCVALAYAANGDFRLAGVRMQEVAAGLETDNRDAAAQVWAQAGAVWLQGQEDALAAEAYGKAIALDPDDPRLHLDLAHVLAAQKRFDAAASEVAAALKLDDLLADAYALQAMLLRRANRLDDADAALANALALDPAQPMARMEQALARARGGDIAGARTDLNDIIAEDPEGNVAETARRYLQELELN